MSLTSGAGAGGCPHAEGKRGPASVLTQTPTQSGSLLHLGNSFLNMAPKAQVTTEKVNKL